MNGLVKIILSLTVLCALVNVMECEKVVVCYHANWAQYRPEGAKYFADDIPANLCTHVMYAFAKLDSNNELSYTEWNDDANYKNVVYLKNQNPELKVLVAIGGWNQGSVIFSNLVHNEALRKKFVRTSVTFLKDNGLDGLDLDWEYPANRGGIATDKVLYITLIKELKEEFANDGFLLTAAVSASASHIDKAYDVQAMSDNLDMINLMAYDLHGSWDPVTGFNAPLHSNDNHSVEFAVNYWLNKGCAPEKLILGLGNYGRSFTLASATQSNTGSPAIGAAANKGKYTNEAGYMSYYEVCQWAGTEHWDDFAKCPYKVSGNQWVGYDNEKSMKLKTEFANSKNLGGIMFWSLDIDDFSGTFCGEGKYPLIEAAKSALASYPTGGEETTTEQEVTTPVLEVTTPVQEVTSPVQEVATPVEEITTTVPEVKTTVAPTNTCVTDGFFADKSSGCRKFYRCVAGTKYKFNCPHGLLFNQSASYCDWPTNVQC